jgi:hypothetical protein
MRNETKDLIDQIKIQQENSQELIQTTIKHFKEKIAKNLTNELTYHFDKNEGKVEKIVENLSLKFSEANLMMENERLRFELYKKDRENKDLQCTLERQAMEKELAMVKQELMEQSRKSEAREVALKKELEEKFNIQIDQKLEAFKNQLLSSDIA